MDDKLTEMLKQASAKMQRRSEQERAEFREVYAEMSDEDQREFSSWLRRLTELCEKMPGGHRIIIFAHGSEEYHDSDGELAYRGDYMLTPREMLRVIEKQDVSGTQIPQIMGDA